MADKMVQPTNLPEGVLKRNGNLVESLWNAVDHCSINRIPAIVREVIVSGAWHKRKYRNRLYEHQKFIDFIVAPPLAGCGWRPENVEALLKDDAEVLTMWREATVGKHGGDRKSKDVIKSDNITLDPKRGTSRAYTLDRLKRERDDLYQQVLAGKLSANAAAAKAGWRPKPSAFKQIEKLLPKLTDDERKKLIRLLTP